VEFIDAGTWAKDAETSRRAPPAPAVEIIFSRKDGLPVPRYGGKTIHSQFDPREEARRFVDATCQRAGGLPGDKIVLLGNGFGYAAEAFAEKGVHPVVFEPCRPLFGSMAAHRDATDVLRIADLFLIDDPSELYRSGPHRDLVADAKAVIVLPYVSWLYPGFAERFRAAAQGISAAAGAYYRISVVSPLLGGSWEIARYAANGLRGIGHPVDFIDVSPFGAVPGALSAFHARGGKKNVARSLDGFTEWCSERIMERVERFDPGIVLVLAQAPLARDHVRRMREEGRRVVFWFVEDFRLFRYWEECAAHYDMFFPIQKGEFPRDLEAAGQRSVHYLPMAADDTVFRPMALSSGNARRYGSPLSFMGAGYHNRRRFFNILLDRPFKIWGSDWPASDPLWRLVQEKGRRVNSEETAMIFNGTDVNVNLHSSTSHDGVNPFGDFVNPRTFEIAACGAFQLVDRRSLLPEHFVPGKELVCFSGREDFLDLADRYLAHAEERREYASRARERVLAEHTYRDRMREMLEAVHAACPPESERRLPTVAEMAKGEDRDWADLLSEFPQDRPLDFDTLLSDIQGKDPSVPITGKEAFMILLGRLRSEVL
jgi:spore maturation protein CgeB